MVIIIRYTGDDYSECLIGLLALSRVISTDALHDASARFPPPKCHPATRKEVIRLITNWLHEVDIDNDILWLYGPAGAGKSAIAQTIAELIYERRSLAGTFFFLRGKAGRDDGHHLFPTLAYQLALHIPGLRALVNTAMLNDLTVHSKTLETQLKTLIVEPLRKLGGTLPFIPLVIVDGLDECQDNATQTHILTLIAGAQLPIRFLVASRPEPHIRKTFESSFLARRTRRILLDDSFKPDEDIRVYLVDGFIDIYQQNLEYMSQLGRPWPSSYIIRCLVKKSSGQFVYAATVLKFVGAENYDPVEQLDIILQPPPLSVAAFSSLDQLYAQILLKCPYTQKLVRILSLLLVLHCPQPPQVYDDILGFDHGKVASLLRGMHSLIRFPNVEEDAEERTRLLAQRKYDQTRGLRLHHASFRDFLLDRTRSGQFFVNLEETHGRLIHSAVSLFTRCISLPWR